MIDLLLIILMKIYLDFIKKYKKDG